MFYSFCALHFSSQPYLVFQIDVQIATYHLLDHIEWDLLSPMTPETFAGTLCQDLGLAGEAIPLVAHAIHEELIKHKRDAIEWGVIGETHSAPDDGDRPRDRSGLSLLKDKTGLGLGWGRTPKDGRGPKALRSVWRDWPEAEEFKTRFEVLSAEEVERREVERERASRYVVFCLCSAARLTVSQATAEGDFEVPITSDDKETEVVFVDFTCCLSYYPYIHCTRRLLMQHACSSFLVNV